MLEKLCYLYHISNDFDNILFIIDKYACQKEKEVLQCF